MRYTTAAHINRNTGREEPVAEHLELSSALAKRYAEKIGMPGTAGTVMLGHDPAKMAEKFQKVLHREAAKVNHAAPSAAITYSILKKNGKMDDPDAAAVIYNLIKGHHEGLLDSYYFDGDLFEEEIGEDLACWLDDYGFTDGRGKENAIGSDSEKRDIMAEASEILDDCPFDEEELARLADMDNTDRMLGIRMLFSCCVDADYTSSAYATDGRPIPEDETIDPDSMLEQLEKYHNGITSGAKASPINRLRDYVYKKAEESGGKAGPGMYTMTAPTGLGKTLAMINWGLRCAQRNGQDRIFIVLPYLSIIQQNAAVYKDIFGDGIVIEDDSVTDLTEETKQMADRWNAKVIITTNVKFLETMFSHHPSTLRRLHNVANSVVIFDESQSLPSKVADITVNTLMALKKYNTSVLFSTATPPAYEYRADIDDYLGNTEEVIPKPQKLYNKYTKARKIKVRFDRTSYSPDEIADMFADEDQALYIVNTKAKAEALFGALEKLHGSDDVLMLSTDMCKADREDTIREVRRRLKNGQRVHLVSTQCVEAGVDIDFPCGMREYGPLTSVIQALGRVGREGNGTPWAVICGISSERGGFPNTRYRNETKITEHLTGKRMEEGAVFDVNNLAEIKAYYEELFSGDGSESRDEKELTEALEDMKFESVDKNYTIIDKKETVNVIVPYGKRKGLFDEIAKGLGENSFCIDGSTMKRARDITVSIYRTKKDILEACEQLYIRSGRECWPTNWFLMSSETGYRDGRGITAPEGEYIL